MMCKIRTTCGCQDPELIEMYWQVKRRVYGGQEESGILGNFDRTRHWDKKMQNQHLQIHDNRKSTAREERNK